jgi:hypothetical protein
MRVVMWVPGRIIVTAGIFNKILNNLKAIIACCFQDKVLPNYGPVMRLKKI